MLPFLKRGWTIQGGLICLFLLFTPRAEALSLPSLPLDSVLNNLTGFLSKSVANAGVKTLGLVFDHRPLEPATPLGTKLGLDLGVEVDVVQLSPELSTALADAGFNITLPPILPSARMLNVHKGLSDSMDVGASYLNLNNYVIWGLDLKIVLYRPEEGITWAVRLGYTSVHFPVGSTEILGTTIKLNMDTTTWTPQLLISKRLEFADPYLGVGYQYVTGSLNVTQTGDFTIPGIDSVKGSGGSPMAFLGVSLRIPNIALRITVEGTYSTAGYNALGTKVGLSF